MSTAGASPYSRYALVCRRAACAPSFLGPSLLVPVLLVTEICLNVSVRRTPRSLGGGLDACRAWCRRGRVPDRREVRYCTQAGDTLLPTQTLPGNVNVRASVVREKREA